MPLVPKLELKDLFTVLLSVTALGVSYISYRNSEHTSLDVAGADAIKTEYQIFKDLARAQLEHPHLVHLFAVTVDGYRSLSSQVGAGVSSLDAGAKRKLLLQERAMADYIFTAFEETYYHWDHARKVGDKDRAALLHGDLEYFQYQLCNSRLAWYWDKKGGNLGIAYAADLQDYYKKNVLTNCVVEDLDPDGPFQARTNRRNEQASSRAPQ